MSEVLLLKTGEYSQTLWLIVSGSLSSIINLENGTQHEMVHLTAGHTIGIQAVLADQPADADYQAKEKTLLLGISKYALTAVQQLNSDFSSVLKRSYSRHTTEYFLTSHVLFSQLNDNTRRTVLDEFEIQRFKTGETIVEPRDLQQNIYFVLRGFVQEIRLDANEEIIANYPSAGDTFAYLDSKRRGTFKAFTAATACELALLSKQALARIEKQVPGFLFSLQAQQNNTEQNVTDKALGRLVHGNHVMAIDTRFCVDCNNCVSACERRHGHSRLDRENQSLQIGNYHFPGACYHCDDPKCLLCSVDGIMRLPSGEIQIQSDNCIGCGACASRCPYGNIRMVNRKKSENSIYQLLGKYLKKTAKVTTNKQNKLAVKCDLCANYDNGPACVRSCPTGAAMRVDPAQLKGSTNNHKKTTAKI